MSLHAKRKETSGAILTFTETDPKLRAKDIVRLDRQAGHLGPRYHFLVEHDGTVVAGRPEDTVVPAFPDCLVISLVGDEETQTVKQLQAAQQVAAERGLQVLD